MHSFERKPKEGMPVDFFVSPAVISRLRKATEARDFINLRRQFSPATQEIMPLRPKDYLDITESDQFEAGDMIRCGWHGTQAGVMLIAVLGRAVVWLGFPLNGSQAKAEQSLLKFINGRAALKKDFQGTAKLAQGISESWLCLRAREKMPVHLVGSEFRRSVWKSLLDIPVGRTMSYAEIAQEIGKTGGQQAVGQAVGANPVSVLVPCHRVIQTNGSLENYAWGTARKKTLLAQELMYLEWLSGTDQSDNLSTSSML